MNYLIIFIMFPLHATQYSIIYLLILRTISMISLAKKLLNLGSYLIDKKINEVNKKDILSVKYIIRPISNIFSIIFISVGISPNTITYLRLMLSFFALIYSLLVDLVLVPA